MADTVEWVLGREQRIIVLAHNGHIQRMPIATPTGTATTVDTLGVHLTDRLGDRHLTIGTTCGDGQIVAMRSVVGADGSYDSELYLRDLPPADYNTIDCMLDSGLAGLNLLDLRTLGPQSAAVIDGDPALKIDVRRAFDMLIHVPRISLWTSSMNAAVHDEHGGNISARETYLKA
jgi:erythromycin esterase